MSKMKLCKVCQKEVAKSAKVCPHCGAKLKGGSLKIIIGVVIVFVIIIAIASSGGSGSNNDSVSTSSTKTTKNTIAEDYSLLVDSLGAKSGDLKLDKKTSDFILKNQSLFPTTNDADKAKLTGLVDKTIDYKHLDKSVDGYTDKVMELKGTLLEVKESKVGDKPYTYLHFLDSEENSYQVMYLGKVDLLKDDVAILDGIPVTQNTFKNISGGSTKAIIVIAGAITKSK